jgi:hypothetical protein
MPRDEYPARQGRGVPSVSALREIRQHDQPGCGQFPQDAPDPGGSEIVGGTRQWPGDPHDVTVGGRDDLEVHAVAAVLARVERPVCRDAVNGN